MLILILGFVAGVITVLLIQYILIFGAPWSVAPLSDPGFRPQFSRYSLPKELKEVLQHPDEQSYKKKESCIFANLILQFLYQEFRDTSVFRRWVVKKLQMEFNDLLSRTAAGRLVKHIKLRDFYVGAQLPVMKTVQVSNAKLSTDEQSLEEVDMIFDLEYRGGLQLSVDVDLMLGRSAFLAVKLTHLSGKVRFQLTRNPYTHWSICFLQEPVIDFDVDSTFHGRPLPQLVPVIINQFKRITRKKHVFPAYKMRYKPFFVNPFLVPSTSPSDFAHILLTGYLDVSVMHCTRVNVQAVPKDHSLLYFVISLGNRPSACPTSMYFVSMALRLQRHHVAESFGLTVSQAHIPEKGEKCAVITHVVPESTADHAGCRVGDLLVAINNLKVISDRHADKLLNRVVGDLVLLVERPLSNIDDQEDMFPEKISPLKEGDLDMVEHNDDFVHVEIKRPTANEAAEPRVMHRSLSQPLDLAEQAIEELDVVLLSQSALLRKTRSEQRLDVPFGGNDSDSSFCELLDIPRRSASLEALTSSMQGSCSENQANSTPKLRDRVQTGPEYVTLSTADKTGGVSRKQRLKAKAINVAQKIQSNPKVKAFLDRRFAKGTDGVGDAEKQGTVREPVSGGISSSKSLETKLGHRIDHSIADLPVSRQTRSKSEVDPKLMQPISLDIVEHKGRESPAMSRNTTSKSLLDSVAGAEQSTEAASGTTVVDFGERTTHSVSVNENPYWREEYCFQLGSRARYLNVGLWSKGEFKANNPETPTKGSKKVVATPPTLLAYTSICVPEILNDCSTTLSHEHQQAYSLQPMSCAVIAPDFQQLVRHPGFDARLCYGDVTLAFRWCPETWRPRHIASGNMDTHARREGGDVGDHTDADSMPKSSVTSTVHDWVPRPPQQAGNYCLVCQKKIWLQRSPLQCTRCALTSHKKCLLAADKIACDKEQVNLLRKQEKEKEKEKEPIQFSGTEDNAEPDYETEGAAEAMLLSGGGFGSTGSKRRFYSGWGEKFTEMRARRRRSHTQNSQQQLGQSSKPATASSDLSSHSSVLSRNDYSAPTMTGEPEQRILDTSNTHSFPSSPVSKQKTLDTSIDWTTSTDNINSKPYYSSDGGTYNEHIIYAAKDLGKDLLSDLPLKERKSRIDEQIDKLHLEIDNLTKQRFDWLKERPNLTTSAERSRLDLDVSKLDDKIQSLAVLMLHYCAGLQNCLDLEEAEAAKSAKAVDDHHDFAGPSVGSPSDSSSASTSGRDSGHGHNHPSTVSIVVESPSLNEIKQSFDDIL